MKPAGVFENWVEAFFLIVIILGFIISIVISKAYVSYVVVFLLGLLFGKLVYRKRKSYTLSYVILAAGFVIGFLIGNRSANTWLILLLFVFASIISYLLHENKMF